MSTGRAATLSIAGFLTLTTACSSGGDSAATEPPVTTEPAATTAAPVASTSEPAASTATTVAPADSSATTDTTGAPSASTTATTDAASTNVDGGRTLATALAATSDGYRFASTASIGDQVAVTVDGNRTADGTQMRVVSQGAAIEYVVTDGRSWVFDAGVWQELDDDTTVEDPLAQLGAPLAVAVSGVDGDLVRLVATYPAAALGLSGADVDVLVEVVGERVTALEYATALDGVEALVRTELSALPDPVPTVTAPDA